MSTVEEAAKVAANLSLLAEGKTKLIYAINGFPEQVLIRSKDQLTAYNATRKNDLEGKAAIANETTCKTLGYLQRIGVPTHFIARHSPTEFLAQSCKMIPIEWVARRLATGSFLKRFPGIEQGYTFHPPKVETHFKDDAAGDPQWWDEQIEVVLGHSPAEIALMRRMTTVVFEALERAWATVDCQLIDMKIEFGLTATGQIVVADVIDNDSWRVWPKGDKRLQLDKQVYRDAQEVTADKLKEVLGKYEQVCSLLDCLLPPPTARVFIIAGSSSDLPHCQKIAAKAQKLGLLAETHVCSAHKAPLESLALGATALSSSVRTVIIAVAGRSNGLGPILSGSSPLPVISCPPPSDAWTDKDIWSSLRMPSGMGSITVLGPEEAALAAAKILGQSDHVVFGSILGEQLANYISIFESEQVLNGRIGQMKVKQ